MMDRDAVYTACSELDNYLAANHNHRLNLPYGNACDRANKGQYKQAEPYQKIASLMNSDPSKAMEYAINGGLTRKIGDAPKWVDAYYLENTAWQTRQADYLIQPDEA